LSLALFIAAVDQTIVATATVRISEEFDALSQAPWLANAYLLSSTALQPTTGKLSDIFGRTPILVCSLVVFAVGSLVCALAHSIAVLLVGRAIAGAGSAGIIGLTLVIVADIVPMRKRGPYMAVFSLVFSLSSVIGPLLGGFFTDHVSWRWIFWLSEPITGFVIIAVFFLLRLPRPSSDIWAKLRRIDYLGIVLLVGGLVAILMGLNLPNSSHSWKSPEVIVCLVLGTVVIGAFLAVEWRFAADPVVPLRLFRVRNVASMMAASFFMGACLFIPVYYVPIYYNVVRDTTSTIAGIYLLPFVVGIMITSIASGFLVAKFGKYRLYMWSGTALCTVGLGLLALLQKDSGMAAKICYLLIAGLGVGSFIQLSLIAAQAAVSVKDMASTTAVLSFFRSIGSVVGMAVTQTVFLNALRDKIHPLEHEYHMHNKIVISSYNNPSVIYDSDVPEGLRDAIIDAYMHSLRLVFLSMIAFGGLMFLSTLPLEH
ncbi:MFS general substrate transporter, partial [Martensiomyces pterosporus]